MTGSNPPGTYQNQYKEWTHSMALVLAIIRLIISNGYVSNRYSGRGYIKTDLRAGYLNLYPETTYENNDAENGWDQLRFRPIESLTYALLNYILSTKEASKHIEQFLEQTIVQRGLRWSSLGIEAGKSRSFSAPPPGDEKRVCSSQYNTEIAVSRQSDLFGKIRSPTDTVEAVVSGSEADRSTIRLSLVYEQARI